MKNLCRAHFRKVLGRSGEGSFLETDATSSARATVNCVPPLLVVCFPKSPSYFAKTDNDLYVLKCDQYNLT